MSNTKLCLSCNKSLAGKYANALTCSSTCRGRIFRLKQETTVPVKLTFTFKHFEIIRHTAGKLGVSVSDWLMQRAMDSDAHASTAVSC